NQQLAEIDESFLIKFGIDTRYVFSKPSANGVLKEREDQHSISYVDEWGTRWEKPYSSFYYDPTEFPLASASIDDLKNYLWPNPNEASKFTGIEEEAIRKQNNGFAVCTTVSGVFEQCWYLTGLERILIEIIENPKFVEALMDKVLEIELSLYSNLLDKIGKNIDMIELWEDISTQKGPLVSPRLYRKIIKPRTKTLVQAIKSKTNAKIALHSCGSVSWAIDDLIDIGVEVLNPVQVSAENMDTKILKNKYGNILSFWGGIDTQGVLPRGTVQEVEDEVKKRIDDLAPGGGYLLAPVHNIQPDVPPENIIAVLETCLKYGIY
ncbi:MAG: uroporphyrinogen decarboxylase family protein, partial [Atribacterota bacterium]